MIYLSRQEPYDPEFRSQFSNPPDRAHRGRATGRVQLYLGLWEMKANPSQIVDVVHIEDRPDSTPLLHLKNEDTLTVTDITLKYCRPAYAAD